MSPNKHKNIIDCPACQEKLKQADDRLANWALLLRASIPELHISWSYRDELSQTKAFKSGHSKLQWPDSKHNTLPSQALDFFQIDANGVAYWQPRWLASALGPAAKAAGFVYGGDWVRFKDFSHVELA